MEGSPNFFAWLALLLVAPLAFIAFSRWPAWRAAYIVVLVGNLLLPCVIGFNLPIFPDLDKQVLPSLWALIACLVMRREALLSRAFGGAEFLLVIASVGTLFTTWNNGDPLTYGPTTLPGLTTYGGISDLAGILCTWFPPFYLGRALIRTSDRLRWMMTAFVISSLCYSVLILIEVRMSPQIHRWIYGFHPSAFVQTLRWGGYRPMVFMRHGLNLALYITLALLTAAGLFRAGVRLPGRVTMGAAIGILVFVLILCKSTGAYFMAALGLPVLFLAGPVGYGRFAGSVAVLVLVYPMARAMEWIPVDDIIAWFSQQVGEERALSLWFRFHTEGELLEHARQRLWFGWGAFGRNHVYDLASGAATSVLDGLWVIMMTIGGVVGWACHFGMVTLPILTAARKLHSIERPADRGMIGTLAVVCALYVFDWVPNSSVTAELTFMVGALAGAVPGILAEQSRGFRRLAAVPVKAMRRRPDGLHSLAGTRSEQEGAHVI